MSSDIWVGVLAFLAACGIGACAVYQARTPTPEFAYASRAGRAFLWFVSVVFLGFGLAALFGDTALLGISLLGIALMLVWFMMFAVGAIIAPRWITRVWLHPANAALARSLGEPGQSFEESLRQTRRLRWVVAAILILLGVTPWMNIWVLPIAFAVLVVTLIVWVSRGGRLSLSPGFKDRARSP